MKRLIVTACAVLAMGSACWAAGPIVVLKLDDLSPKWAKPGEGVSSNWKRTIAFLEKEQVPASFGLSGKCLEDVSPDFVKWAKETFKPDGMFELWNHGYDHSEKKPPADAKPRQRFTEFSNASLESQVESLKKTQTLAKEKLGITITAFGTPFNTIDKNTEEALKQVPEIKVWFYGRNFSGKCPLVILPRSVNLEHPTMKPNFEAAKADFEKNKNQKVMAIQGHAGAWKPDAFEEFKKFVLFLKEQGCVFMTPEQYAKQVK